MAAATTTRFPQVTVTRNWGDGFVAADVCETPARCGPMSGKWIIAEKLARRLGAVIPRPVTARYHRGDELGVAAGAVARVPFWRMLGRNRRKR